MHYKDMRRGKINKNMLDKPYINSEVKILGTHMILATKK
jgi:hypothetical protein